MINYFLNLKGLVIIFGMIEIYLQSLLTALTIWIKLMSISIVIFNISLFQDKFALVGQFKKLFGFFKIFKVNSQKIAQHIVLMLLFVEEIINTFESNTKKDSEDINKYNLIDRLIDRIKLALSNCEAYYKKFETKNSENLKNINYLSQKNNAIDIIFIILYTIFLIIRIYIMLVF